MRKNKKDLLLVAIILAIAAAGFIVTNQIHNKPASRLEITVDGKLIQTLNLQRDIQLTIEGYRGGTNHLIIKDGLAQVDAASCPDKVCIHQGLVSLNGQMIVCLPNRMVAKVIAPEE